MMWNDLDHRGIRAAMLVLGATDSDTKLHSESDKCRSGDWLYRILR
jgi:hypothetical protein